MPEPEKTTAPAPDPLTVPEPRTVLAVGAHIGDMDLTAGPLLAEHVLAGGRGVLLALTPGERGHPRLSPDEYKAQKLAEGEEFARDIGAEFRCFDDLSDGFLATDDEVALRLADVIREVRPEVLVVHWPHSIHSDHEHAAQLALRARYLAGLPLERERPRHGVATVLHAENWEDQQDFTPDRYVPVSPAAFRRWRDAIGKQAFARGETYGFRYIDYYTALLTLRGCLARTERAVALATAEPGRSVGPL